MRRMLFFDIDGTLVNSRDRTIPDSAGRAIRLARAAGHLVYVNSGRPWCGVDPRVKAMGFHGFVCGCGLYIREGDEILFRPAGWPRMSSSGRWIWSGVTASR